MAYPTLGLNLSCPIEMRHIKLTSPKTFVLIFFYSPLFFFFLLQEIETKACLWLCIFPLHSELILFEEELSEIPAGSTEKKYQERLMQQARLVANQIKREGAQSSTRCSKRMLEIRHKGDSWVLLVGVFTCTEKKERKMIKSFFQSCNNTQRPFVWKPNSPRMYQSNIGAGALHMLLSLVAEFIKWVKNVFGLTGEYICAPSS